MAKDHNGKNIKKGYSTVLIIMIGVMLLFIPGIIPILGPFFAGIVIGYLSGELKKSIITGIMSAIVFTLIVWIVVGFVVYPYMYSNHIKLFDTFTGSSILILIGSVIGFYEIVLVVIGAVLGSILGDKSKD